MEPDCCVTTIVASQIDFKPRFFADGHEGEGVANMATKKGGHHAGEKRTADEATLGGNADETHADETRGVPHASASRTLLTTATQGPAKKACIVSGLGVASCAGGPSSAGLGAGDCSDPPQRPSRPGKEAGMAKARAQG